MKVPKGNTISQLQMQFKNSQHKKVPVRLTDAQVIDHLLANNWERGWITQSTINKVRQQLEAKR